MSKIQMMCGLCNAIFLEDEGVLGTKKQCPECGESISLITPQQVAKQIKKHADRKPLEVREKPADLSTRIYGSLLRVSVSVGILFIVLVVVIAKYSKRTPDITMHKYTELKSGLSHSSVEIRLGREGEELARSDTVLGNVTKYLWRANDGEGTLKVIFVNGKLVSKEQSGLK